MTQPNEGRARPPQVLVRGWKVNVCVNNQCRDCESLRVCRMSRVDLNFANIRVLPMMLPSEFEHKVRHASGREFHLTNPGNPHLCECTARCV